VIILQTFQGRAVVQTVSRQPLNTEARLRPQASSLQTCCGQGGNGTTPFRQWDVPMRLSATDLYKPTTSLHYMLSFGSNFSAIALQTSYFFVGPQTTKVRHLALLLTKDTMIPGFLKDASPTF
jgi:hypothetical protein